MEETPQTVPQSTWHPRNLPSENSLPRPSGLASPLAPLPSASLPTIPSFLSTPYFATARASASKARSSPVVGRGEYRPQADLSQPLSPLCDGMLAVPSLGGWCGGSAGDPVESLNCMRAGKGTLSFLSWLQ